MPAAHIELSAMSNTLQNSKQISKIINYLGMTTNIISFQEILFLEMKLYCRELLVRDTGSDLRSRC